MSLFYFLLFLHPSQLAFSSLFFLLSLLLFLLSAPPPTLLPLLCLSLTSFFCFSLFFYSLVPFLTSFFSMFFLSRLYFFLLFFFSILSIRLFVSYKYRGGVEGPSTYQWQIRALTETQFHNIQGFVFSCVVVVRSPSVLLCSCSLLSSPLLPFFFAVPRPQSFLFVFF